LAYAGSVSLERVAVGTGMGRFGTACSEEDSSSTPCHIYILNNKRLKIRNVGCKKRLSKKYIKYNKFMQNLIERSVLNFIKSTLNNFGTVKIFLEII